jgi:hypothetical protein
VASVLFMASTARMTTALRPRLAEDQFESSSRESQIPSFG